MTRTPDDSDADDLRAEPSPPVEPPVMPTAEEAAAAAPPPDQRPAPVRHAFVVWVLAGVFGVVNEIVIVAQKQRLINEWVLQNPDVPVERIARGTTTLVWLLLVAALCFAALFTLFAYKAQDGVRRARLMLTMLGTITVVFYVVILVPLLSPFGLVAVMLTLAGMVLLYLPKSNVYFRPSDAPA